MTFGMCERTPTRVDHDHRHGLELLRFEEQVAKAVAEVNGSVTIGQELIGPHGLEGVACGNGRTCAVAAAQIVQEGIGGGGIGHAAHGPHAQIAEHAQAEGLLDHGIHAPPFALAFIEAVHGLRGKDVQHGPLAGQGVLVVGQAHQSFLPREACTQRDGAGEEAVAEQGDALGHGFG